nr:ATP-binding cassette domain-containing protein [uncultured Holophaga sp.]
MQIDLQVRKRLSTASGPVDLKADLCLASGELVAFFGPSGVGKTTLLRILAGLTDPEEGYVSVGGEVWLDTARSIRVPPQRRSVGLVFQDYALFPNMSIRENLRFAQKQADPGHLEELLEVFGLLRLQDRRPDTLSGGQKQRVALARALARKPGLLLLDEPLSALDHDMRSLLQDEILQVHRRWGITTILVSHDLQEVFKLCHRVIAFRDGQVIDDGDPHGIFSRSPTSGKLQLMAEVLHIEREDVVDVCTLLIGHQPVQVALCRTGGEPVRVGDRVRVTAKAFNPVIERLETAQTRRIP